MNSGPSGTQPVSNPVDDILELVRRDQPVDVERALQIYCNRNLNFDRIEAVGFDMDYTLAQYHQVELDALSVRLTLERLVRERGYPEAITEIEPRPDFAIRGLVVDKRLGNILKLDAHRHVGKGYHGFRELTSDERHAYREQAIRLNSDDRFVLIDTLFALPEAFMLAALVDFFERTEPDRNHEWPRLMQDIRYCIDLAHRDGSIKQEIMADTERYIARDPDLAMTLHKFRSAGKKLFLLTNSYPVYSSHVMRYLLDGVLAEYPSWQNYFDVIVAGSGKPRFFTDRQPFLRVRADGTVLGEEYAEFERNVIYQGGNLVDFERMLGIGGERIVYIGDHIYGDIVRSKKSSAWRTVMVVQEMETELSQSEELREDVLRVEELDGEVVRLTEEIAYEQTLAYRLDDLEVSQFDVEALKNARRELMLSRDRLRRRRRERLAELDAAEEELEKQYNPYWGLIFKLGNENTLFGEQVEDYACLYTSRVSNFVNYSPLHYFRAPRQWMPHER